MLGTDLMLRFLTISIIIIIINFSFSLVDLRSETGPPDLSGLTWDEKQSIELACRIAKLRGEYNDCLRRKLNARSEQPDSAGLTRDQRQSSEMACRAAKLRGEYNDCLRRKLTERGERVKEIRIKKAPPVDSDSF